MTDLWGSLLDDEDDEDNKDNDKKNQRDDQRQIETSDESEALSPVDLLVLPEESADLLKALLRENGMTLTEVSRFLDKPSEEAQAILDDLIDQGHVRQIRQNQASIYKMKLGRLGNRKTKSDVWSVLDDL